ncbi:hypothetical protein DICVIV_05967 [Dictyocaulus viviparus]|uniref:Proteasome activator Blm10 middle HEAT repeats region domain-containing protein n=1 Tax=Dictyocaulus viviparus TaxID=29172 RepID=A0A0D8XVV1_DICVI|nr:hypothetical protein DICVIV_05967 [Dictyocaulus viviparus]
MFDSCLLHTIVVCGDGVLRSWQHWSKKEISCFNGYCASFVPLMRRTHALIRKLAATLNLAYQVSDQRRLLRNSSYDLFLQKPSFVIVEVGSNVSKEEARAFGRHEKKFVLLPYYQQLSLDLDYQFEHIKHGLVLSVLVNENRPALRNYIFSLKKFLEANGFRFSKSDHLKLIRLMYLIMVKKDQWHDVVHYAARALEKLINSGYISGADELIETQNKKRTLEAFHCNEKQKCHFTHDDMVLEWEPVYNLYYGATFGKLEDIDGEKIRAATFQLKRFYKPSDSVKIWERVKVHLAPHYSTKEFCEMAILFLKVKMSTNDHKIHGASLWFETMWKMYEVVEMGRKWGDDLPNFFATLVYNNPDFMDWTPLYDVIFTHIIRALGLCLREGKVVPFMHPSNESEHTLMMFMFLQYLIREFLSRYEEERVKKHRRKVAEKFYLTDTDIKLFVEATLQSILYSLYSKNGRSCDLPAKLLMMLGVLQPCLVFPKFLEKYASSFVLSILPHYAILHGSQSRIELITVILLIDSFLK